MPKTATFLALHAGDPIKTSVYNARKDIYGNIVCARSITLEQYQDGEDHAYSAEFKTIHSMANAILAITLLLLATRTQTSLAKLS